MQESRWVRCLKVNRQRRLFSPHTSKALNLLSETHFVANFHQEYIIGGEDNNVHSHWQQIAVVVRSQGLCTGVCMCFCSSYLFLQVFIGRGWSRCSFSPQINVGLHNQSGCREPDGSASWHSTWPHLTPRTFPQFCMLIIFKLLLTCQILLLSSTVLA